MLNNRIVREVGYSNHRSDLILPFLCTSLGEESINENLIETSTVSFLQDGMIDVSMMQEVLEEMSTVQDVLGTCDECSQADKA